MILPFYEEIFSQVDYFVESTWAEQYFLWEQNKDVIQPTEKTYTVVIGHVDEETKKCPIHVSFSFKKVYDKTVCFYTTIGRYNDRVQVEEFVKKYCKEYNGRPKNTDATNFNHCLNFCKNEKSVSI